MLSSETLAGPRYGYQPVSTPTVDWKRAGLCIRGLSPTDFNRIAAAPEVAALSWTCPQLAFHVWIPNNHQLAICYARMAKRCLEQLLDNFWTVSVTRTERFPFSPE